MTLGFASGQNIQGKAGKALTNTSPLGANESYVMDNSATGTISTTADAIKEGNEQFRMDMQGVNLPSGVTVPAGTHAFYVITPPPSETPGLVFDRTDLRWNEGMAGHSPPPEPLRGSDSPSRGE